MGVAAALFLVAPARADDPLTLFDGKHIAGVIVDGAGPLATAGDFLAHDLTTLSGQRPVISTGVANQSGTAILIGLANAPLIASLLKANHIDTTPVAGKWEVYGRVVLPAPWDSKSRVLVIFGSDIRGTIWGVSDLSREMGVSPWEWWADVTPRRAARITVDGTLHYAHAPSVKYRGIFLNDEDFGLKPWAAKTYEPEAGTIGPKTYARVFELMWRLKANTIWPAMHKGTVAFDDVPGNAEMAARYAIIHATSHAEPMLRNNDREWDAAKRGPFNYLTNRANMLAYWDEAVASHKQFENIYTMGLRGVGDVPMIGANSASQTGAILQDVIAEQRKILANRIGEPVDRIPQVFTPYKEVLLAYDTGLKLPDDITLTWPDDNYGYIRRLSNPAERARSGGSGVYYHISYWGGPTSYLWLATTHPALLWEEMNKAWRFDAHKIWILNVGDIKPGEYLTELFLDMAFDADDFANAASVRAHLGRWAAKNFGPEHAAEITDVMWRYYDLAFARKPEFMGFNTTYPTTAPQQTAFNMLDFGDENARRAAAYRDIAARAATLKHELPPDRQDAFYELVEYPVAAAAAVNTRSLDLDKAIVYGLQRRASANDYSMRAQAAQTALTAETAFYNDKLANGKWRGMMDVAPHKLPQFAEPAFPTWKGKDDKTCAVQVEGGAFYEGGGALPALPPFQPELRQTRYVDLFLKSPAARAWKAVASVPWIRLSTSHGTFSPGNSEQRINASIDWDHAPDGGGATIAFTCEGTTITLPVAVKLAPRNTVANVSFVESDRIVSIYATHADMTSAGWEMLDGLGHTGSSLRSVLDMASLNVDAIAKAPVVVYRFATSTENDKAILRVIALPTLPITSQNGTRVAISLDGATPVVLDLATAESSAQWRQNVLTNTAIGTIGDLNLKPGAHELKVFALDPGLILDRFEIAFAGAARAYGPVPETRIVR